MLRNLWRKAKTAVLRWYHFRMSVGYAAKAGKADPSSKAFDKLMDLSDKHWNKYIEYSRSGGQKR